MSCGAKTLLHAATQQPARFDALVLVSAAPYFPQQARELMAQLTLDGKTEAEWQVLRSRHKLGDAQVRSLWTQARAMKDSYDDVNFTPPLLSTITARTLIVHGDRDFYPVQLAVDLYNAIPHSYLSIVPNAAHGPIFGDLTPRFLEIVWPFLRGDWNAKSPPHKLS
jgi:pimeloyl-ACP methyl ester carboxylesterase